MLKERALKYFLHHIMCGPNRTDNYDTMVARTYTHFETREGRIIYEQE
jgi:hypothetical protein